MATKTVSLITSSREPMCFLLHRYAFVSISAQQFLWFQALFEEQILLSDWRENAANASRGGTSSMPTKRQISRDLLPQAGRGRKRRSGGILQRRQHPWHVSEHKTLLGVCRKKVLQKWKLSRAKEATWRSKDMASGENTSTVSWVAIVMKGWVGLE